MICLRLAQCARLVPKGESALAGAVRLLSRHPPVARLLESGDELLRNLVRVGAHGLD